MEQISKIEEAYTDAVFELVQAIAATDPEARRLTGDYMRSFLSGHPDAELEDALLIKKTELVRAFITRMVN